MSSSKAARRSAETRKLWRARDRQKWECRDRRKNTNKDGGNGVLNDTAFAIARSATRMDKTGNGHSSITSKQKDERELSWDSKVVGVEEGTSRSRQTIFMYFSLYCSFYHGCGGEECTSGTLHLASRGQNAQCKVLWRTQNIRVLIMKSIMPTL